MNQVSSNELRLIFIEFQEISKFSKIYKNFRWMSRNMSRYNQTAGSEILIFPVLVLILGDDLLKKIPSQ